MAALVTDEILETIAIIGKPSEVVTQMKSRLGDVIHRTSFAGTDLSAAITADMLARLRD